MPSPTSQTKRRRTIRKQRAGKRRKHHDALNGTIAFPLHPEGYDPNAADAKGSSSKGSSSKSSSSKSSSSS